MPKAYPLKIESVGEDDYIVMSRGHHDPHEFMRQARADGYDWPLGMPQHCWTRRIPATQCSGYPFYYVMVEKGTRGAFPTTCAHEEYGDEQYEAVARRQAQTEQKQGGKDE